METPKIAAKSWTEKDESKLDSFSTTCAEIVSDPIRYPGLEEEALLLTNAANNYHVAFSRFETQKGTANKEAKDYAKFALYEAHQAVATKLEQTYKGDLEYLTRPGYLIDQTGGKQSHAAVAIPIVKSTSSTSRGEVRFILKAQYPREIKAIIGEYSTDGGVTWQNGITAYRLNFTISGQPSGQGVLYRFMFIATNERESKWSKTVYVDVF